MVDGLLLGLSTGLYCVSSCAPLTVPLVCSGDDSSLTHTVRLAAMFMAGRFIAYIAVGFILGSLGSFAASFLHPAQAVIFSRISYLLAGVVLMGGGIILTRDKGALCTWYKKAHRYGYNALAVGIATGFSVCPPFFAAASRVFGTYGSLNGALYFLLFFLGTSVYFIPIFGLATAGRTIPHIKTITRTAMVLIGGYFFFFMGVFNV